MLGRQLHYHPFDGYAGKLTHQRRDQSSDSRRLFSGNFRQSLTNLRLKRNNGACEAGRSGLSASLAPAGLSPTPTILTE